MNINFYIISTKKGDKKRFMYRMWNMYCCKPAILIRCFNCLTQPLGHLRLDSTKPWRPKDRAGISPTILANPSGSVSPKGLF